MICLNLYWMKPRWGWWFFHANTMWSICLRIGPLGIELNNNHVWTLTERVR